ncbi:hemerythrin domain-containing protein [Roseateles violae]|uniref:Hemerythrin domain-containing protein n=1 Tax=Roseateles violae TaxID=3058042 RepID=A0ABT8DNN2_9BURK|nr:hemerythrin domain-containing protein [Pelomonas sp. PFR6]MDN3919975.1 hemerythrin domain-containing protein [Pelomonas sp. PFR6]
MPTPAKASPSPARPAARSAARPARQPDAIAILREDHKKVAALFEQYEHARSASVKRRLVETICHELKVHTAIEEEVFYPAFKAALKDKELVPEARVEHASVKSLIEQVEGREPDGEDFDAKLKVMGEFVKHHVKEEQNEMFPKARKSRLDLVELGRLMAERKQQLMAH